MDGRVQVLKLLAGHVTQINSMHLMSHCIASLERTLQNDSALTTPPELLMGVASYLYHMDTTMILSVIARLAQEFPQACLKLLKEFCKQSTKESHLILSGAALVSIPPRWVANTSLTHVKLSGNLLLALPEELFQVASLQTLNVSRNCLEKLPSVLKWNCPKLKELDVSHNRLLTQPYGILEGRKNREQKVDANPPSIGKQRNVLNAVQSLLNLTGYNLYPCICSITRVSISHNPGLTQVGTCMLLGFAESLHHAKQKAQTKLY